MSALDQIDVELPIGRMDREPQSDDSVRGGSARGLHFEVTWGASQPRDAVGVLRMYVADTLVWGSGGRGAREDLAPFLQFLATRWDALVLEQGYPRGVTPTLPSQARRAYTRLLQSDETFNNPNTDDLKAYECNHNLAAWTSANLGSDLWVVREGSVMVLQARDVVVRWPFHDVVRTLTLLGDAIARRLRRANTRLDVLVRWESREKAQGIEALALSLRLALPDVRSLLQQQVLCLPASRRDLMRDMDEVHAAARMLASRVGTEDVAAVAAAVKRTPSFETPELDALSQEAGAQFAEWTALKPFQQGQNLAHWLRAHCGKSEEGSQVDPAEMLRAWNVHLEPMDLAADIEAVSVWGPTHGPAVLLNRHGRRSRATSGRPGIGGGGRATLAHEICHLLIDRGTSLPVAEVFGGATPRVLEQRANSFAAEFLVPMKWAAAAYRKAHDVTAALDELTDRYKVTRSLVAQQILNDAGGAALANGDKLYLEQVVGRR